MVAISTPGTLSRRAELFYQLSQLTAAGVDLSKSGSAINRGLRSREARQLGAKFELLIQQGSTATEALQQSLPWLSDFELSIIQAGEKSGRLDETFRGLSEHYASRARLARQILGDLAYPAFLYHFAVFILPFPDLFSTGNILGYSMTVLFGCMPVGLVPIYIVTILALLSAHSQRFAGWRDFFERITRLIPLLGNARGALAIARLSAVLEALISAGVTIIQSWELAAQASGSPALLRTVQSWRPRLEAGKTPGELVNESRLFPEMFAQLYSTGETTGKLDDTLRRLHTYYLDEGTRKIQILCKLVAWGIYLMVVAMIVYRIITFYVGFYGGILDND